MIMKKNLLLMVLALGMCCISVNAQNRELNVENDGFRWYKVVQNGKEGAITPEGRTIIPTQYFHVSYHTQKDNMGYFTVWVGSSYENKSVGVYSKSGTNVIPTSRGYYEVYKMIEEDGIYYSVRKKDGKQGACDANGREIIAPQYESLFYLDDKHAFTYRNSSGEYIDTGISLTGSSSSSSSSSGSNYDYVFEFNTFYLANTKVDEKATFSISKSGVIKVNYGGSPFEYKCKYIEVVEGLLGPSHITFCGTDSDDKLELSSTGIIFYDFLSTPISESVKKDFNDIMKKVKNKTIFSSPVPIREK